MTFVMRNNLTRYNYICSRSLTETAFFVCISLPYAPVARFCWLSVKFRLLLIFVHVTKLCFSSGKSAISTDRSVNLCLSSGKSAISTDRSANFRVSSGKQAIVPDRGTSKSDWTPVQGIQQPGFSVNLNYAQTPNWLHNNILATCPAFLGRQDRYTIY